MPHAHIWLLLSSRAWRLVVW